MKVLLFQRGGRYLDLNIVKILIGKCKLAYKLNLSLTSLFTFSHIFCAFIGTNKNPKYFDEPESFDPSRFEGNAPVPYTWLPFGAGPRTCPGKDYVRFVVLNFIHILITKFHLGNYTFSQ